MQLLLGLTISQGLGANSEQLAVSVNDHNANSFEFYKQELQQNPHSRQALYQLAQQLFKKGEYAAALPYVERLARLARSDIDVLSLKGRILTGNKHYQQAETFYLEKLAQHPNQKQFLAGYAELLFLMNRKNESRQRYLQLLTADPSHKRALMAMFFISKIDGNFEQSAAYLERLLMHHYNDRKVHMLAARYHFEQQRWDEAEEQLDQLELWQGEQDLQPGLLRARIAMARLDLPLANEILVQLLQRYPTEALLWYTLAETARLQQQPAQALQAMETALRLSPQVDLYRLASEQLALLYLPADHSLRQELAEYRFQKGNQEQKRWHYVDAQTHWRRAVQLVPSETSYWLTYNHVFFERQALQYYLRRLRQRQQIFADEDLSRQIKLSQNSIREKIALPWLEDNQQRFRFPLQIVALPSQNRNSHSNLSFYVALNVQDRLSTLAQLRLLAAPVMLKEPSVEQLQLGSQKTRDFLILELDVEEMGPFLRIDTKLFLGRSGEIIERFRVFIESQNVAQTGEQIGAWLEQLLPSVATVIGQQTGRVIINQGWFDGLDSKQGWTILGSGRPVLTTDYPYFTLPYLSSSRVEIELVDEQLAQGRLEQNGALTGDLVGSWLILEQRQRASTPMPLPVALDPDAVWLRDNLLTW